MTGPDRIADGYARATELVAPLMRALEAAPGCGPCDALDAELGRVDRVRGRTLTAKKGAQIEPADWIGAELDEMGRAGEAR